MPTSSDHFDPRSIRKGPAGAPHHLLQTFLLLTFSVAAPVTCLQVMLTSSDNFGPRSIREVQSEHVNQLVRLPGIVTAASKPRHKATHITVQCTSCKMTTTVRVAAFGLRLTHGYGCVRGIAVH